MPEREIKFSRVEVTAWSASIGKPETVWTRGKQDQIPTGEDALFGPGPVFMVKLPITGQDEYGYVNAPTVYSPFIPKFPDFHALPVQVDSTSIPFGQLGRILDQEPRDIFNKAQSNRVTGRIAVSILPIHKGHSTLFSIGQYPASGLYLNDSSYHRSYMVMALEQGARFNGLYICNAKTDITAQKTGSVGGNFFDAAAVADMSPQEIMKRHITPSSGDMMFYAVPVMKYIPPQQTARSLAAETHPHSLDGSNLRVAKLSQVDVTDSHVMAVQQYGRATGWQFDPSRPNSLLILRHMGLSVDASPEDTARLFASIQSISLLPDGKS